VLKPLKGGVIYPISDSEWVSPVQVVSNKGGIMVISNEKNELIPQWTVTDWQMCIDYQKLNKATWKDHFPLSFIDEMLERLANNSFFYYLEWREKAYHSAKLYKERTKRWHDMRVKTKQFKPGDKVLLFNSHVHLFSHGKLRSKWEGPYLVLHAVDHGAITLQCNDGDIFKVNGQRLKLFLEPNPQDFEELDVLDFLNYNDYIHRLRNLNSVVIPRLGFPFSKISFSKFYFQISKIRGRSELSGL
jgi:hypothetical protein